MYTYEYFEQEERAEHYWWWFLSRNFILKKFKREENWNPTCFGWSFRGWLSKWSENRAESSWHLKFYFIKFLNRSRCHNALRVPFVQIDFTAELLESQLKYILFQMSFQVFKLVMKNSFLSVCLLFKGTNNSLLFFHSAFLNVWVRGSIDFEWERIERSLVVLLWIIYFWTW